MKHVQKFAVMQAGSLTDGSLVGVSARQCEF